MDSELYFQAAILGVLLAFLCIMGWRRIVPCFLFFCLVLGSAPSALAQYDDDNDVPAINEVRDALLAQKLMLDNYFSGYTSPNKLNDISNALYKSGNPVLTTIDNRLDTLVDSQHTGGISSAVFLYDIQQYIQGNYSGPLTSLAGRTFDSDDDVPTLENIELNITDLDLHNQSSFADVITKLTEVKTALENIDSTPSQPTAPTITYTPDPVKTFAENAAEKVTPPIESDVTSKQSGFEDVKDTFEVTGNQDTAIPLLTGVDLPPLVGNPIATVNTKMVYYADNKIGPIIKPILTAFLIVGLLTWTTKYSIRLVAS